MWVLIMNKDNFILYEWNHETKEFWFLGEKIDYIHNPTEWREHLNNLVEENKRLKENNQSMQEEIREYIKEHNDYLEKAKEIYIGYENELLKSSCIQLINNEFVRSYELLQILDKAGKE